ncbi:hypothetical protein AB0F25_39485 [Streptomyces wedmorensis]|uniref:hypothetical protein n=1 Tax=Streptomyces wedmorensis TaxID=43759 RepID=UPI003428388F
MDTIDRADDTLRHLARYRETVRQNDDPKRSPSPAPASIRSGQRDTRAVQPAVNPGPTMPDDH